ncbi:MAG: ABC transporter ATP-binding protein [Myxococcota bacterium]|jgi:ABC-2 type transport system ATP-binding protein|nr:ABC transporter ATP-binding protein [Myxococcota bacterium]
MASDALVTRGLTRSFGGRLAISGLDLDVREGDVYGFLGPNGAGKTTAIRCVLGLLRADSGEISIFGERHPVRRRRGVGAMVEAPAFHGALSGWKNLELACLYMGLRDRDTVRWALDAVGLGSRGGDPVRSYSQGMRQRLGLARALVGRPRLLLLDEPTNGLDPRGMKEVRDLVRELARREGLTVLMSSHLLHEVEQLCTRVGILDGGRLVAQGDVRELLGDTRVTMVDVGASDPVKLGQALAGLSGVELVGEGESGRVRVRLQGVEVHGLNRSLVQAGVQVQALSPVEGSLEELYLSLTEGRK